MYVGGELPAFVLVAEEVSDDCEERADGLHWHVPFGAYYLESCQMVSIRICLTVRLRPRPCLWER
jgi:hypothetical protein